MKACSIPNRSRLCPAVFLDVCTLCRIGFSPNDVVVKDGTWNVRMYVITREALLVTKLSRLLSGQGLFTTTHEKVPDIFGNIFQKMRRHTHGPDVINFQGRCSC